MILACNSDNDLYRVLCACDKSAPRRVGDAGEALAGAASGEAVLLLADQYPKQSDWLTPEQLQTISEKRLRVYAECPSTLPGLELGEPVPTQWERAVVSSDFFGEELPTNSILALHGCWYVPVRGRVEADIVVARVAGYRNAAFGIPGDAFPILFGLPGCDVLVCTSKLSQFATARYGPRQAWAVVWKRILQWLTMRDDLPDLHWEPTVGVQAAQDGALPADAECAAFARVMNWFSGHAVFSIDTKRGGIEGFESGIDYLGRQRPRVQLRSDCVAETGMAFAWDWAATGNPASKQLARETFGYVWSAPDFWQSDPELPVYGLVNWYERGPVFYGDDDARVILSTLAAARLLGDDRWDEKILRCVLANFRTTGPLGFRQPRLDWPASFTDGRSWEYWRDHEVTHLAPHYQGYLWAAFLWAYALTGHKPFYDRAHNAIRMTMEAYPQWRWTNGLTQEMARMLLPLALLVRVNDTPQHRQWLTMMADDLIAQMQVCGAIKEKLGPPESGAYPPPKSNESYGTAEASLIQEEGDPACDLLYTANYAFIGLHEAACATGDPRLQAAEDKLAEFLCRIQVRSKEHPYLDGAWMRSFDYDLWEYWGSSADLGWGAWSVESGWTNSWIAATLAMRGLGTSLFDLTLSERLGLQFPAVREQMMP